MRGLKSCKIGLLAHGFEMTVTGARTELYIDIQLHGEIDEA